MGYATWRGWETVVGRKEAHWASWGSLEVGKSREHRGHPFPSISLPNYVGVRGAGIFPLSYVSGFSSAHNPTSTCTDILSYHSHFLDRILDIFVGAYRL